jgi:Double zinc ribbon
MRKRGTLIVTVKSITRYIDDLGKSRQATIPKAWHAHKTSCLYMGLFYPSLAEVGKCAGTKPTPNVRGALGASIILETSAQLVWKNGRDTMDEEKQSEESREESALLKLQEEFHQFLHECRDCRREIEAHWQFCAHCGTRLATHCPGCGNPLPPPGAHACPRCGVVLPQGSP